MLLRMSEAASCDLVIPLQFVDLANELVSELPIDKAAPLLLRVHSLRFLNRLLRGQTLRAQTAQLLFQGKRFARLVGSERLGGLGRAQLGGSRGGRGVILVRVIGGHRAASFCSAFIFIFRFGLIVILGVSFIAGLRYQRNDFLRRFLGFGISLILSTFGKLVIQL